MASNSKSIHIAILAAMPEEIGGAITQINNIIKNRSGDLTIYSGEWIGKNLSNISIYLSIAWSGWGKVSSARAATRLLSLNYGDKKVDLIIFTGVAGAVDSGMKQWDVIIANALIQHDMDARPMFKRFVIPAIGKAKIQSPKIFSEWALKILLKSKLKDKNWHFGNVIQGLIGTGDKFIANNLITKELKNSIPKLKAVEMEGAAVAQVAYQENIPWIILRVISDGADQSANLDFNQFITNYNKFSWELITYLLESFDLEIVDFLQNWE